MEYILWFEQITKDSIPLAGGKGANLGEMFNLKLPVPPGFAITTKAYNKFLEVNRLGNQIDQIISSTDVEETDALMQASATIKKMIEGGEYPMSMKSELIEAYRSLSYNDVSVPQAIELISAGRDFALVAVRSSATAEDLPTASFAGQQATFLNIKGVKNYLDSVRKAWASLFEPRAIFYRNKQN
ncbi:MAG: phosphoenolpyruvate synthase, partial [Candidatus Aenigmarchaeota archaeon]|nr:phosphoenolpyruvate synthase [Candidatus Aenigmarchaeota archaeon]